MGEKGLSPLSPATWYNILFISHTCRCKFDPSYVCPICIYFSWQHLILLFIKYFVTAEVRPDQETITKSGCRPMRHLAPTGKMMIYKIDFKIVNIIVCSIAGVEVTCSCRSGFAGDGFTCEGNIIQVSYRFATGNYT